MTDLIAAHGLVKIYKQPVAEWNPTSTLTAALRERWGNPSPPISDSLASTEPRS